MWYKNKILAKQDVSSILNPNLAIFYVGTHLLKPCLNKNVDMVEPLAYPNARHNEAIVLGKYMVAV